MSEHITITAENFQDEVLQSKIPVLLDFWASWCNPCRMVGPFVEQLAVEYKGQIKVGKVNVDEESDLAGKHGIVSVPTLLVYKDGNIANQAVGALPKHSIEALFKEYLS